MTDLVLRQNMASLLAMSLRHSMSLILDPVAEFRGPGVRHRYDDSGDDFDIDMDSRRSGKGDRSGRIILLGDGTEMLTDGDDDGVIEDEDTDFASHLHRESDDKPPSSIREETPGPEDSKPESGTTKEISEQHISAVPDTTIPEKLTTPDAVTKS